MSTESSAGAQALGYIYQIPYSLYLILEDEEDIQHSITVEGLGDIESRSEEQIRKLLELKRHKSSKASLADRDVDLWRTIRVWSRHLHTGKVSLPGTSLKLITTAKASRDSIAWLLSPEKQQRNWKQAYQKLIAVAQSPSKSLEPFTTDFQALPAIYQRSLVEAVEILTDSPDFTDLTARIKAKIKIAAPEHTDKLYDSVIGWWHGKIINHLQNDSTEPIMANAVHRKINEIGRQFAPDALPPYYRDDDLSNPPDIENKQFVIQLKVIGVGSRRIEKAVRDYYRASQARLRWVREELLFDEHLFTYDKRLVEEWEDIFDILNDTFKLQNPISIEEAYDTDCKRFGQDLYRQVQEIDIPINNRTSYSYVTRGSYHRLADEEKTPKVWWHPKFNEQFKNNSNSE